MEGMRVLVVEDERLLADAIAEWLRGDAHAVDVVYDGDAALERLGVNDYDVVVLDRDLPVVHGDEVCRALVGPSGAGPGADAHRGGRDRRPGRRAGASAPTTTCPSRSRSPSWSARVQALGRRARPAAPPVLQPGRHPARPAPARGVSATAGTCRCPARSSRCWPSCCGPTARVVSAEQLLEKAWDEHADPFTNAVRMTILKLRRKLGDPPVIETVPGVGYRIP